MFVSMQQQPPQQTSSAPDDRATEFQPVKDTGESFNGYSLMVEAYAVIWIIMMAWLLMLWRKQASLGARVVGLEEAINRAEKKLAGSAAPLEPGKP